MGLVLFRLDVPSARSAARRRPLAGDVAGTPAEHAAVLRKLAAASAARCLLEARLGLRGLRRDPMPGLCRRWVDRWIHECDPAPARTAEGAPQGSHRAMGACLSAFRAPGPADRLPPGDAALVGPLAQGHRHRRDGRADAARLDDGERAAGDAPRAPCRGAGSRNLRGRQPDNNAAAAVPDRRRLREAQRAVDAARRVFAADGRERAAGNWTPFGRGHDQAGDQRPDDARSLVFDTPPLDAPIEMLGAPVVTLDLASDRPIANLVVRLCDVHPSGESLRVSYGVLNLTHRDGHERPAPPDAQDSATACASGSTIWAR